MPYQRKRKYGLKGRGDYSLNIPFTGKRYVYKGETPFASVGKIVGTKFGRPMLGEGVGHAVGRLFGSGDYKMGVTPNSNSIWNSTQTPKFAQRGRGNIITNREYIGDVTLGATPEIFTIFQDGFTINPGLAKTFPWLSTIAQNYEQFKIHGMIFEFKSTVGDNSTVQNVGTVIMGTEYNVNSANFANKQVMENSEFAQSGKATESQIHGIECASKEHPMKMQYVRTGALASTTDSIKWYDFANFQIATQGFNAAQANTTIGELWVSYQIEFFKPQIPTNIGGAIQTFHAHRINASGAAFCGSSAGTISGGTLGVTFPTTNTIRIPGLYIGNTYTVSWYWVGTAANVTNLGFASSGMTVKNRFAINTAGAFTGGVNGVGATQATFTIIFVAISQSVDITLNFGVIPTAAGVDIYVQPFDNTTP